MQLGVDSFAAAPAGAGSAIDGAEAMRELLERVEQADQVELDVFGIGELHRKEFLDSAPTVILGAMAACTRLYWLHRASVQRHTSIVVRMRDVASTGGIDLNKPRMRAVLAAVLALAPAPTGFTLGQVAARVQPALRPTTPAYQARHAAYDLKKLRAKGLIGKVGSSRRYQVPSEGLRTIAALVVLRDKVIKPILAGTAKPKMGRKPKTWSALYEHYETVRKDMQTLFKDLGLAT